MKVEEFLDLSMKSRPEIIENHLCHRVTHHRGWQGKVIDFLRKEATEDTIERVQIFENQIRHLN
jgi:acetolactate synthase regulatory subunit